MCSIKDIQATNHHGKLLRRRFDMNTLLNLVKASKGEIKSDLIIRNVNIVDVILNDVRENVNIAIWNGYIVRMGYFDIEKFKGNNTLVLDGSRYEVAVPGFIDPHIHIESSMLTLTEFSKLALIHGTTTIAADPHEIANVLGVEGIKLFLEESKYVPLKIFFYIPSCVPPTKTGLDTPGSSLNFSDVKELLKYEEVIGLGEVMDFLGIVNGDNDIINRVAYVKRIGKIVDGHAPQLPEDLLIPYSIIGIRGDHESSFLDEALTKLRVGMRVLIREGSAWKDLEELASMLVHMKVDNRYLAFTSDDLNVLELARDGHMDRILRKAVSLGMDPIKALQLATINAAEYLGLSEDIGSLNVGKLADIVLLSKFTEFKVRDVITNGKLVVIDGKYVWNEGSKKFNYPAYAYRTIRVKFRPKPEDLLIRINSGISEGYAKVIAIRVILGKTLTRKEIINVRISNGYLLTEGEVAHVAVIERHHATGNIGKGFVIGLGISDGAIAQTIAHDVHNIIVIGKSPSDMSKAVNEVIDMGGGLVAVLNNKIIAKVRLPIAGLMSDQDYETVLHEVESYVEALRKININFRSAFMTIALLSLPVIPEIRITDKGLVDVLQGRIIKPLIELKTLKILSDD